MKVDHWETGKMGKSLAKAMAFNGLSQKTCLTFHYLSADQSDRGFFVAENGHSSFVLLWLFLSIVLRIRGRSPAWTG